MRNFLLVLFVTTIIGFLLGFAFFNLPHSNANLGPVWANPIKYVIRGSITSGVSAKTIALLLLLTVVAAFIAGTRHLIGIQSFGIFLPTALAVVFVVIGPIFGIGLFILIIAIANLVRFALRTAKIRLQYLPRMAFILWAVVVCVLLLLFLGPLFGGIDFNNISVLPFFILILLAEDFIRVQLGKSVRTAINLTTETLILALVSYLILSFVPFQQFALLNPEILLISVAVFDFVLGKYIGLRFIELWRFRKLINS